MLQRLYYTPPSDSQFEELRNAAIELWKKVDTDNDRFGYASEKIDRIKNIQNVSDNFMFIVAMFDMDWQRELASTVSHPTRDAVRERMEESGMNPIYITF